MKASDAVAKLLYLNNITVGFELIGGMIAHLVDSINQLGQINLISLHHEQAAAFAAGGVARATNNKKIGLALGTSGPGATNLITGIADCWLDNYPCVFITGQVNTYELKGDKNIRQQGFQELGIVSLVSSITKFAVQIETLEDLLPEIQKAINIAKEGRPGPVLIDIPMDLQREEIDINFNGILKLVNCSIEKSTIAVAHFDFKKVNKLLSESKRPLFLIGGGACNESLFTDWQEKISQLGIPHVASLKGSEKTTFVSGYLGLIGAYGTRVANYAVQNADLLVVLGSRLDVRQTGANVGDFARNAKNIIQIDIDTNQLNNRVVTQLGINSSCNSYFNDFINSDLQVSCADWLETLKCLFSETFKDEYPEFKLSPFQLVKTISEAFKGHKAHFIPDVGNHQMWVAHTLLLDEGQKIHHSAGLGAMGFSLPTAIGIQSVTNDFVISISGDGGFHLNIQELDVIARDQLPILIIILNNHALGMVKNFQDMYFDGRNKPTYWDGYSCSFETIGKAYNIESHNISAINAFNLLIKDYIENPRPLLIEISMENINSCKPRLAFGKPIDEQYPSEK